MSIEEEACVGVIEAIGMFAREARGKDARGKERSRGRVNITQVELVYIMMYT